MIFVNQSIGNLSNDMIEDFVRNNEAVVVLTGRQVDLKLSSTNITYFFGASYNRLNTFTRVYSWLLFTIQALFVILKYHKKHKDIFLVSNPPTIFFVSLLFKRNSFYFLVYDLYPDILKIRLEMDRFYLVKLWSICNIYMFRAAKVIFTISDNMKNAISTYTDIDKIVVVNNWFSNDQTLLVDTGLEERFSVKYSFLDEKKIFVYSGNMGETHDFTGTKAFMEVYRGREDVCFLFIGSGSKKNELELFIRVNNINNVHFLDRLDNLEFHYVMRLAYFGIVALDHRLSNFSVPSKTFSYLGFKLPLLNFTSSSCEVYSLVEEHNIGINISKENLLEGVKSVEFFIDNKQAHDIIRNNAYHTVQKLFSKSNASIYLRKMRFHEEQDKLIT
jgi:colanic acid biosynthesis glycosyl transferase WcaI